MFSPLLALACTQNDLHLNKAEPSGADEPQPDIVVEPQSITFDALSLGASSTGSFTVRNDGEETLNVADLVLTGTTAFSLTSTTGTTLTPGASATYTVNFTPQNPEDLGYITISSNDPDQPQVLVELGGAALVPELTLVPDPYDFGEVLLGCGRTGTITATNTGLATLNLDTFAETGEHFTLSLPQEPPFTLEPGASFSFELGFTPPDLYEQSGELWITTNDLLGYYIASHHGGGTTDTSAQDEFWQGDGPWEKTDILVYVDQSGSMTDDQANLAANFNLFVTELAEVELDWQLIVSTTDDGCHNGEMLDEDTPNPEASFLAAVNGPGVVWTEAGLTIALHALNRSVEGECNEGFLRENAKTMIILVSDEPEQSRQGWSEQVASILAIAPTAAITSVVGDYPHGCPTAAPGAGYYEASMATGGAFLSICEADWGSYFETIATLAASGTTDTFKLSAWPETDTITVTVDDTVRSNWSYDVDLNAVVFDRTAIPDPGAHIVIDYDLLADCEQ